MKFWAKTSNDVHEVSLRQDRNTVDILVDGELVAFFTTEGALMLVMLDNDSPVARNPKNSSYIKIN